MRERVHKEGARYKRGEAKALAAHVRKPPSWVSTYVDEPPTTNADIDTALLICDYFGVKLTDFADGRAPAPPMVAAAAPSRHFTRAVRLLGMMSDDGQREAAGMLATVVRAYPRAQPRESIERTGHRRVAGERKERGKR